MVSTRARGGALVLALVMTVLIVGVTGALLSIASADFSSAVSRDKLSRCGYLAQSGVQLALVELNSTDIHPGGVPANGRGNVSHGTREERVFVQLQDATTSPPTNLPTLPVPPAPAPVLMRLLVTAQVGRFPAGATRTALDRVTLQRQYVVHLKPNAPFPHGQAALAIIGTPEEAEIEIEGNFVGAIGNGRDQAGGPGVPGLGIENMAGIQDLELEFPATAFTGFNSEGASVQGAQNLTTPPVNFDVIAAAAQKLHDYTLALADGVPRSSLAPGVGTVPTPVNLGIDSSSVTVIDTRTGRDEWSNLNVTGQGTLIILAGEDFELKNTNVTWNGDIFVVGNTNRGGDGEVEFEIDSKSSLTVNGGLFLLATGGEEVELEVKSDSGAGSSAPALQVNGPLLALADRSAGSEVEIEIETRDRNVIINGYMGLFGNEVELEIEPQATGSFQLNGELVIGTPPRTSAGDSEAELEIAATTRINFNSALSNGALDRISNFLTRAQAPVTYTVGSWREEGLARP